MIIRQRRQTAPPAREKESSSSPLLNEIDWDAAGVAPVAEWSEETKNAVAAYAAAARARRPEAGPAKNEDIFASRRIERLEEELKRATRVRDDFMSIASHELKTPVTALRLQFQLLRRGVNPATKLVPSAEKLASILDMANRQVDRLAHLIEDLVDVARIEAGELQYEFASHDVAAIAEETLARFAGTPNQPKLITASGNEPLWAFCDRHRIEQVLTNLISNAIKYGGERPGELRLERSGTKIKASLRDFGNGIPAERQKLIFDRFERAVSYHYISGLGLGLFISREIAEAHDGSVTLLSKEGEGATFTLAIPAQSRSIRMGKI